MKTPPLRLRRSVLTASLVLGGLVAPALLSDCACGAPEENEEPPPPPPPPPPDGYPVISVPNKRPPTPPPPPPPPPGVTPYYDEVATACAAAPVQATRVYYACDCAADADADCQAGSDGNSGASAAQAYQTLARAMQAFNGMEAGEAVVLCQGGSFTIPSNLAIFNFNCTAEAPCTLREYTPDWGSGDEGMPRLTASGGDSAVFAFEDPNLANHDGGYRVHNLEIRGQGMGNGVQFYNDVNDVDLCNLDIHDFGAALYSGEANAPDSGGGEGPPGDADEMNARITLRGSTVHHNRMHGWLGAGDDVAVESNLFDWNGMDGTAFAHSIYIGGVGQRVHVASNIVTHSSQPPGGRCNGTPLVVHGRQSDLVVEGNVVRQEVGEANAGCWGLTVSAAYGPDFGEEFNDRVLVRHNRIFNVGNVSIGVGNCRDCVVESNLVVQGNADMGATALAAPDRPRASEDAALDRLTVRSNTFVLAATGGPATGINIDTEGSGFVIANNVVLGTSTGPLHCMALGLAPSAYASDYNVCFAAAASSLSWNTGVGSLATFQAATGLDAHSKVIDPLFSPSDDDLYVPAEGSPLIDAADPATSATTDITGDERDEAPDIGAFEAR